jgi:hypothetical protein
MTEPLPPFAAPVPAEAIFTGVGIASDGHLYLYGDDPRHPGTPIPAVTGRPCQLVVRMLGARGRYGARPYLELYLEGEQPEGNAVLRIPAARPTPEGFVPTGAARSLLPALACLPVAARTVSITSKRGESATFLNVFPQDSQGQAMPQVRVQPVAADLQSLASAIEQACAKLDCQTADILQLLEASS